MAEFVNEEVVPPAKAPRVRWGEFVQYVIEGNGAWVVEEAPSENSATTAATRLRGRGKFPLVERDYFEVRLEGPFVFARISPDATRVITMPLIDDTEVTTLPDGELGDPWGDS